MKLSRRAALSIRAFARKGEGGAAGGATPDAATPDAGATSQAEAESRRSMVCRACGHAIAPVDAAVSIAGSHLHTFMNPGGFVFEIVCYREAPGTRAAGAPSSEWSWFPGYVWQIALCGACKVHLGWGFRSEGDSFFGLVRDRIGEASA